MLGLIEKSANVALWAIVALVVVAIILAKASEVFARLRASKRRQKHPLLAAEFRYADEEERFIIAQRMMTADRVAHRALHGGAARADYPIVWDYYIPPGALGYLSAVKQRAARAEELTSLTRRWAQEDEKATEVSDGPKWIGRQP